ncbi:MAG TPA: ATP-binding cassette domain-containing protein [Stellaceae bacterium]|nr:ATP-binding cassette domain-containing protein [Stellaceae bacterium]
MTTSPLLTVENIYTAYGLSRVLFGVSLEINAGECVVLLGRNGVGKSTTMRSVMGLTPPTSGRVMWKGQDIAGWSPHRVARSGIGFVPEDRRIFAELSVWENLDVASRAAGRRGQWTIDTVYELFPVLRNLSDRQGGFLSGGEQQMLTIARTLMGNPELLLLDEPSEGLAPLVVEALLAQIGLLEHARTLAGTLSYGNQKQLELGLALASDPALLLLDEPTAGMSATETHDTIRLIEKIASERALTLLFTEHDMDVVFSIAQKIAVLHQGRLIADGAPAEVRADPTVRRVYLGDH